MTMLTTVNNGNRVKVSKASIGSSSIIFPSWQNETSGNLILTNEDATIMTIKSNISKAKSWYDGMHFRHIIRFAFAFIMITIGLVDILLLLLGKGFMDWISAIVWIIGSVGLLGTATYLAIDSDGD